MARLNISSIKNTNARRLVRALERYGCSMRTNGAHWIIKCPNGSLIMSTKNDHVEKQWNDLERLGIDINLLKEYYK
jgi:predicted RNA binding protein YcfA (HicA-like mRNA interferase family)